MAHEVETMAYTGEMPWHGLGVPVSDDMTPEEMLIAANLDWTVSKRPAYTIDSPTWNENVGLINATGHHYIVRDIDNSILSHCGDDYTPFQNETVFKFFKKFVSSGTMKMETAGSLREGRDIWGLAKIKTNFTLPGEDKVEGYLLINSPHIAGKALIVMFTPIRVVCANTMALALDNNGKRFRVLHLQEFDDDIISAAEEALGLSENKMEEFHEKAEFLCNSFTKPIDVQNYVAELFQPKLLLERGKLGTVVANDIPFIHEFSRTADSVYEAIYNSPGSDLKSAKNTWWGALNGVTYMLDHKKRETERVHGSALYSSWMGPGAITKRKALDLALKYAKAA
jgi:phage/plasmid-like protein (TIGR03299 family)